MKIIELIDELKEEIEKSPKSVLSNRRAVDPEVFFEILRDMRNAVPEEIKKADAVNREKEQIIEAAMAEAANIIASAEDELRIRISDEKVAVEAETKAKELMQTAEGNAREITVGAKEYADDILQELESYITEYLRLLRKNRLELSSKRRN